MDPLRVRAQDRELALGLALVQEQEQERPLSRQGSWVAALIPQSEATAHATWMPVVKPSRSMK